MAIKTSIGTPTANSYVSVASADEYFDSRENSDSWIDITSTSESGTAAARVRKENLLVMATREIDNSLRYHETKYNMGTRGETTYQNLEFPRSSNFDADSALFIPDEVKWGTYEQALWIMERTSMRTTNDGIAVAHETISDFGYNYIKGWVNRQVRPIGSWAWEGSYF